MSKIKIKNFGPIKEGNIENNGWIEIPKITLFIGNQGSGKSTVAKLISTFSWIEKALVRGDYDKSWFKEKNKLKNHFLNYHRLNNYFTNYDNLFDNTEIEYLGDRYLIKYEKGSLNIEEVESGSYQLPQIMYVPAERNFLTYVKSPKELKLSSDSLKEFLTEFENAKRTINNSIDLPINNVNLDYDKYKDDLYIKGENYKLNLTDASSGFQSIVPLFLVSQYLANSVKNQSMHKDTMSSEEMDRFKRGVEDIWSNNDLTDEQKRIAISALSSKFNKSSFINIVEEPEQNLFPSSQWEILISLLGFNNLNKGNKLIMTTHSPYIINYLSVAIQAGLLYEKINHDKFLLEKLNNIIPVTSIINSNDVCIYELGDGNGIIKKLNNYEGIPSDRNILNESIAKGNTMFDSLLEIEQEI